MNENFITPIADLLGKLIDKGYIEKTAGALFFTSLLLLPALNDFYYFHHYEKKYIIIAGATAIFTGVFLLITFFGWIRKRIKRHMENKKIKANSDELLDDTPESKIKPGKSFTDKRDSKTYSTVIIGKQTWMAEDLAYYRSGCKEDKYGVLYTWERANKAPPKGWRLPSEKDWLELINFAGGKKCAGKKLKARYDWSKENGLNTYGFDALPSGDCGCNFGSVGSWWSSTENKSKGAYVMAEEVPEFKCAYIFIGEGDSIESRLDYKDGLKAVRCIKNRFYLF